MRINVSLWIALLFYCCYCILLFVHVLYFNSLPIIIIIWIKNSKICTLLYIFVNKFLRILIVFRKNYKFYNKDASSLYHETIVDMNVKDEDLFLCYKKNTHLSRKLFWHMLKKYNINTFLGNISRIKHMVYC